MVSIRQKIENIKYDLLSSASQSVKEIASGDAPRTQRTYTEAEIPESLREATTSTYGTGGTGRFGGVTAQDRYLPTYIREEQERQKKIAEAEAREKALREQLEAQSRARAEQTKQQTQTQLRSKVISNVERLKGKELTRLQYQKELAKGTGLTSGKAVSELRKIRQQEKAYYRKTGISLEEQRRILRESQTTEPQKDILLKTEEGKPQNLFFTGELSKIIGFTPIVSKAISSGIKAITDFETKKKTEGSIYEKYAPDWLKKIGDSKSKTTGEKKEGFSLTQKYYELFGAKFYESGEREQKVLEGLKNFTSAQDYESQEKAVQELRNAGINITVQTNPLTNEQTYKIDTKSALETFAPTSKVGNILIGLTDVAGKSLFFSPYMTTGRAKKGEAKTKVVEKEAVKKTSEKAEKLIQKAEQLFKEGNLEGELYRLQAKATTEVQKNNMQIFLSELQRKGLIKGFALDKTTGKFVLLDSSGRTLTPTTTQAQTTIQIDISDLTAVKTLERLPEITTSTSFINPQKIQPDMFLGRVNRFEGTQPTGKISSLSILDTKLSTDTTQKSTQKNILGLKQPQQTKTKQEEMLKSQTKTQQDTKVLQALSSLLRTQQQQKLKQQQVQKQKFKQQQKTKQKGKLKFGIPPTIPFDFGKALSQVKKAMKEKPELFEVFGKRFGKDIKLFETKTQKQAEQKLKSFLVGTLGRSGFIKKGGEKIFSDLLKSPQFRQAQREPKRVVQKAKYSLGKRGEIQEISYFRKLAQEHKKSKNKLKAGFKSRKILKPNKMIINIPKRKPAEYKNLYFKSEVKDWLLN